ncbi:Gustatory receptor 93, partial [Frankliniella occidentalis]
MLRPVLRAAQAAAILPPPPGRLRSLQVGVVHMEKEGEGYKHCHPSECSRLPSGAGAHDVFTSRGPCKFLGWSSTFGGSYDICTPSLGYAGWYRLEGSQAVAALAVACWANYMAWRVYLHHTLDVLESGFHLALHAYLVENLLETLQPPIILLATWCNLHRFAPSLGRVLAGPVRAPRSFLAFTVLMYAAHAAGQALFHVTILQHRVDYICYSVASAWSACSALIMDRLVALVLTLAALKIQAVNQRLGSLKTDPSASPGAPSTSASWMPQQDASLDPAVQRGLLQSLANRWESTVEQVGGLLGHCMLGLPLLYSLLHITIGLITAFSLIVRDETQPIVRHVKLIHVSIYLARVASLALTAGWLYRETKMTEAVIGSLDTTAWPIRERQRVSHLLHLSRETEPFRVCGILSIDHSFLFT